MEPRPTTPQRQPARTIRLGDVVKALEVAAERLGDTERSCDMLRAWAAAGRVTPAGQVLVPNVVDAGIEVWLAQKSGKPLPKLQQDSWRQPATPLSKRAAASPVAGADRPAAQQGEAPEVAAAQGEGVEPAASGPPTAKRAKKKPSFEDQKRERANMQQHIQELARARLVEVLKEMDDQMAEILSRRGPAVLEEWNAAPPGDDRQELYRRLVHAVQDPDVTIPEQLNAELMPHQVDGLEWLASLYANGLHGILADEMGLGKTIQTIALLLYIQEQKGNAGPHLIVAPKSTLSNWKREFERFAPGCYVYVLTADVDTRSREDARSRREAEMSAFNNEVAQGRACVCVTNYEQVHRIEWLTKKSWQLVIVDEGHCLKNPETVRHNAMRQMKCRMRLLLTGTPLQNSINELWTLLHYLLPDLFTSLLDFRAWFANPFKGSAFNELEVQPDPAQEQEIISRMHAMLSPFLLQRMKADVLADRLPPRTDLTIWVPMSAWQASVYSDLEQKTIHLVNSDDTVASEQINNAFMQLRKIALHPYLFEDTYPGNEDLYRTSGKLEMLDRLLQKLIPSGHRVLIFSQFTSLLDILENYLEWRKIVNVRLDGQVSHRLRGERIERFNSDPSVSVFLLSSRAGGLGLNLQTADTVILFDIDWNPQNDKQAVARVHRVGQTREVRVIRLLTECPVERHMERVCLEKLEMEKKIMGAGMFHKKVTGEQRREALRAVLGLVPADSGGGLAPGADSAPLPPQPGSDGMAPAEVNRLVARGDKELAAFDKIDARLLRPRGGEDKAAPLLVRSGRLMRPAQVPQGFHVSLAN